MNINQFQEEVEELFGKISEKRGSIHTKEEVFIHFVEEVGEIARQVTNEKIRKKKFDYENLKEEISDSILFLTYFASQYGINLNDSLKRDIEKLKVRFGIG